MINVLRRTRETAENKAKKIVLDPEGHGNITVGFPLGERCQHGSAWDARGHCEDHSNLTGEGKGLRRCCEKLIWYVTIVY